MLNFLSTLFYNHKDLNYCSYSTGGGMNGGYNTIKLKKIDDDNAVLTISSKEYHDDIEVRYIYNVKGDVFKELKNIFISHNLYLESKKPMNEMRVLDGDTTSINFDFDKYDYIHLHSEQVLSKKGRQAFKLIYDYLNSLKVGEPIIEKDNYVLSFNVGGFHIRFQIFDEDIALSFKEKMERINIINDHKASALINLNDDIEIDINKLNRINNLENGSLIYLKNKHQLAIIYQEIDNYFDDEIYQLGKCESFNDNTQELFKKLEDGDYFFRIGG